MGSLQEVNKLRAERNAVASTMKSKLDASRREELIEQGTSLFALVSWSAYTICDDCSLSSNYRHGFNSGYVMEFCSVLVLIPDFLSVLIS